MALPGRPFRRASAGGSQKLPPRGICPRPEHQPDPPPRVRWREGVGQVHRLALATHRLPLQKCDLDLDLGAGEVESELGQREPRDRQSTLSGSLRRGVQVTPRLHEEPGERVEGPEFNRGRNHIVDLPRDATP
jgi:hypothetical protein